MQESDETVTPFDADAMLMRRSADGDRDAFAALYRRHHGAVYRFARLMTGSGAMAEDVVQDVFLALMKEASRYDPRRAALTTYLFGMARHCTRRRLLRDRRFVSMEESNAAVRKHAAPDVAAAVEQSDELRRLRSAILALPSRYREVVILCDLEGVTYEAAAVSVGCAVGTVRSRLHRARQLLTTKLHRAENRFRPNRAVMGCAV